MFNTVELIRKKRDGLVLNEEELVGFISGITKGTIPDYQIAAFAMAVYFQGMTDEELYFFSKAMVETGEILKLAPDKSSYVDKHSTGGVGDKLSLIVAPLAAACGLKVAKMSGRGLGFSGGTIDKLESIPGFKVNIDNEDFIRQVDEIGLGIIGQSEGIAGADKKIYAIRDVTATVESIPLIASSIVSKKISSGNKNIVFDVKVGKGAFMKTVAQGLELGRKMVDLVRIFGGTSIAVITNMDSPLGHYIGNSLEIVEVLETLKGRGPEDLVQLSEIIGGNMLVIGGVCETLDKGKGLIRDKLVSGEGLNKLKEMIEWQGGNLGIIEDYSILPQSKYVIEIKAEEKGFIKAIDAKKIGMLSVFLGAGRVKKEDEIDHGAGVYLPKKPGDMVEAGDLLCRLHHSKDYIDLDEVKNSAISAFKFSETIVEKSKLVYEILS